MKPVYALYASPELAQRAVDALRRAGIADGDIAILSSEPLEEHEFGQRDRATWMSEIAIMGGAVGLLTAYLLTSLSQRAWPLNTGGMPIVSHWANMVPYFELTMLGIVLATFVTLLITARLPGRVGEPYDPEIANGKILIGVTTPPDATRSELERVLRDVLPGI